MCIKIAPLDSALNLKGQSCLGTCPGSGKSPSCAGKEMNVSFEVVQPPSF